ncbi:MAG: UDP-N-acetylglucosamine 2-epimerase, partial [Methanobacterium sp.]
IIEAPSFKLPAINIGERQKGRERASNVIDVKCNENEINMAIKKIFKDKAFNSKLKTLKNPYGEEKTSKKILKTFLSILSR